jgi:hypothetical protein
MTRWFEILHLRDSSRRTLRRTTELPWWLVPTLAVFPGGRKGNRDEKPGEI